jgi:hypothetical protein
MTEQSTPQDPATTVVGREFKHGTYVEAQDGSYDDAIIVKEYLTYADGRRVPHLLTVENFQRPFWVTLEAHRNHKDKKFAELKSRLRIHKSTQRNLARNIARALGRAPTGKGDLRMAFASPYVYGAKVSTPTLFKHEYQRRWPEYMTDNTVAALDAETTTDKDKTPLMIALTMKDKAYLVVVRSYMRDIGNFEEKVQAKLQEYLGDVVKERNIQLEIEIVDRPGEACYQIIQKAHAWRPDFLNIFNVNFDLPVMMRYLREEGYDLAEVFSDPSVPRKYKYFKYTEGKGVKETVSGKSFPLAPAEQWHVAECPASFYIIDSMCVYLKLRIAGGKEPNYKLDSLLQKHLGIRKLKFTQADHLTDKAWHDFMTANYKVEYCIYNLFDCISLEMLDEKTTDLSRLISSQCGPSEYNKFPSQPQRTCDDLHFECLDKGYVIATPGPEMQDENDKYTLSLRHWIVTLPSHLVFSNGISAVEEMPNTPTLFRAHVADLDVEGTYPNEQVLLNISKETTAKEVCKLRGKSEAVQRAVGINLSGGFVNAVEIAVALYSAPTFDRMLADFETDVCGLEPAYVPLTDVNDMLRLQLDEYVLSEELEDDGEDADEDEDEDEEMAL